MSKLHTKENMARALQIKRPRIQFRTKGQTGDLFWYTEDCIITLEKTQKIF